MTAEQTPEGEKEEIDEKESVIALNDDDKLEIDAKLEEMTSKLKLNIDKKQKMMEEKIDSMKKK